ncbi:MAG: phosphoribosylamine--glycine ligase, partial [Bacteroidota bacterium]
MNVLLLGSGGREHAMAMKLASSPLLSNLYIAPGNPGTEKCGVNLKINILDFNAIGEVCKDLNILMVIVGPEEPLVKGITDYFLSQQELKHISVIGP